MELQNGKRVIVDTQNNLGRHEADGRLTRLDLGATQKQEVVDQKVTGLIEPNYWVAEIIEDDPETFNQGVAYLSVLMGEKLLPGGKQDTAENQWAYEEQMSWLIKEGARLYEERIFAGKIAIYGALNIGESEFEDLEFFEDAGTRALAYFTELAVAELVALHMYHDYDAETKSFVDDRGQYSAIELEALRADRMRQNQLKLAKAGFTLSEVQEYLGYYSLDNAVEVKEQDVTLLEGIAETLEADLKS